MQTITLLKVRQQVQQQVRALPRLPAEISVLVQQSVLLQGAAGGYFVDKDNDCDGWQDGEWDDDCRGYDGYPD